MNEQMKICISVFEKKTHLSLIFTEGFGEGKRRRPFGVDHERTMPLRMSALLLTTIT